MKASSRATSGPASVHTPAMASPELPKIQGYSCSAGTCRRTPVLKAEPTDVGPGLGWTDTASWGFYRKSKSAGQTRPTCSYSVRPHRLDLMGGMRTLTRTAGHEVKLLCPPAVVVCNYYRVTDLIKVEDLSQEKCTFIHAPKLSTLLQEGTLDPPKHKGSEIVGPLWLSRAYDRASNSVSA